MDNVDSMNDMAKRRFELINELETLTKKRAHRSQHLSKELNSRISRLEVQIHDLTLKHREEIKKCYSGTRTDFKKKAA